MARPPHIDPTVGDWYQSHGQLFEVIAIDEDDAIIEIQHADGDLEEMGMDDWATRCRAASLQQADPPEDPHVVDDRHDEEPVQTGTSAMDELHGMHASELEGLDLFD
jgi:hypothetical protein